MAPAAARSLPDRPDPAAAWDGALLDALAAERAAYALPSRLRELTERLACEVLGLLFPHFTVGTAASREALRAELARLRATLVEALCVPGLPERDCPGVADAFLAALPGIREELLLDARALAEGDPAAHSVDEVILAYPGFYATAVYRLAHDLHGRGAAILPRLLTELAHHATGIDIHPGARIGPAFAVDHGTGVVVGETAVLGARVRLYQGVTLGAASVSKRFQHTKRHPTIGEDVVIYANATILGGDTVVGRGSRIGGNVWLTRSVPPYSVVTPTAHVDHRRAGMDPGGDALEFHI